MQINNKNVKHSLSKEIFFKHQQITEKIITKLLQIEFDWGKAKIRMAHSYQAATTANTFFVDFNNTLESSFKENSEEVVALIYIYYPYLWKKRDECMENMSELLSQIHKISILIQNWEEINRKDEIKIFNEKSQLLGNTPKYIADKIKGDLEAMRVKLN